MEPFISVPNSIHSYTPCMLMSMEPCFPSSVGFYRTKVRRHTPVSLRYYRMKYAISSLCYCLNIDYWTSKSLQETLCTPTSLRQQSNDVFPLYAVHMGKVQSCGLAVQFREDDGFHHLVRRTTVLTLVPEHQVDVWLEVGCVAI